MRILIALTLAMFLVTAALLAGHTVSRTRIQDDDVTFNIVRESDGDYWSTFERNGVRYKTTNPAVLAELEKAVASRKTLSDGHSLLGRKHSELARENSELGREHARLGGEQSRAGDDESRVRELEARQRELEARQRDLESRQRALEGEYRSLEEKARAEERKTYDEVEQIFVKAVREGKAKRR